MAEHEHERQQSVSDGPAAAEPSQQPESSPPAELTAQVYEQLRAIARTKLAQQRPGHTLQATALVHEAFLKLRGHPWVLSAEPRQFLVAAAQAMRQILIDHARTRRRAKRGGGGVRLDFADVAELAELADDRDPDQILALDEAICRLEQTEPQAAQVVKLRFFGGLGVEEVARALDLSERTVKREWQFARAWLFRALGESER